MVKGFILGIIVAIVAAAGAGYALVRGGDVPAAALNAQPVPLERWVARTSLHATMDADAPKGPNPVPLTDANLIAGIGLYAHNCAICHGTAQGKSSASPIARGEYPDPPQLGTDGVEDDPEGWTWWKVANGIRWTGMPAWKGTLSDQEIWTLALFLKHMDKLPPAAQEAWQQVKN